MGEGNEPRTIAKCRCSGCGQFFVGDSLLMRHRVGKFEEPADPRRCMTIPEMRATGLTTEKRLVRFQVNGKDEYREQDVWYDPQARETLRVAFAAQR